MTEKKETDRPLVTFALFAYNQEEYIREAVEGAFSQTYEPLEIILSDDCSSDRTFEIMQEMVDAYKGPHSVRLNRNKKNLGIAPHVSQVFSLSLGQIVTVAAGDDISLPTRVAASVKYFADGDQVTFVENGRIEFNDLGESRIRRSLDQKQFVSLEDLIEKGTLGLVGAGRTYRKSVLDIYPGLLANCPTEDTTWLLRCLMLGNGFYDPEPLVKRRLHDHNLSAPGAISSIKLKIIRDQYNIDINFARDRNILDPIKSNRIQNTLNSYMFFRILRQRRREGASSMSTLIEEIRENGIFFTLNEITRMIIIRKKRRK